MRLRLIVSTILVVLAAREARADGFVTPFIGYNFGGDSSNCIGLTSCDDHQMNWGVSFGTMRGAVGFEQDIGFAPNFFGSTPNSDNGVLTLMSNLLLGVGSGPVRPYAVMGLGLIRPHSTFKSGLSFDANAFGYDIGGGLTIVAGHVGVRGDVRRMHTMSNVTFGLFNDQPLNFWRATAGLALHF